MPRTHGGNLRALSQASGLPESRLIDASANLNPLGPPPWLDAAFLKGRLASGAYPSPGGLSARQAAATALGLPPERVVFGNGADDLAFALARVLGGREHIVAEPAYSSYRDAVGAAGGRAVGARGFDGAKAALADRADAVVWLGAPNNPDGTLPEGYPDSVADLAAAYPAAAFVVDESFIDFADGVDPAHSLSALSALDNVTVLRSMTKFWCVPGLRVGYAVCSDKLARALSDTMPNWPLNSVAQAFAELAFADKDAGGRRDRTRALVSSERRAMAETLSRVPGLRVFPSRANFYLVRVDPGAAGLRAPPLIERAASLGLGLRPCADFPGLGGDYIRVAVRPPEENKRIADILAAVCSDARAGRAAPALAKPKRAKALMVAGTSSGAGKSLIAAALCRIFSDDGLDVAPYKAQNMALNSAVTRDGLEMGRAQAVQAAASRLEPDVRMNPVLLKPESERGSQVVVMGRSLGSMDARSYYARRQRSLEAARSAYDSLAAEHQLVVMEGAGSPAEINLRDLDIVNMSAALHAGARVLIVGDIDQGGVFASFIGHAFCLRSDELALVSGFVVNKFRGDPALLGDAFAMTEERTGIPVLGCVPMLRGLDIPEEDEPWFRAAGRPAAPLKIAVVALPHGSNLTDLDPFGADHDVELVPVHGGADLESRAWDAIILPGSKSTVADLAWLRERGLADAIVAYGGRGGSVVGICGGFQMLGARLDDPDGVDSKPQSVDGLGLLPVATEFAKDKILRQGQALWLADGDALPLAGYEIHHGRTRALDSSAAPVMASADGTTLGYRTGRVWGSYLHGLFDHDLFRARFLNGLRAARGLPERPASVYKSLDERIQALADAVRPHLDLGAIRKDLGL
ncbi:MAG: cobyric acid synthase [Spirochaetales bacterium]|nr:cobyric acid synthase [Spirochaetales bacterium]